MSAFGNTHVEVLDDRSAILIENVFLAKFAELCATVVEHHIGGLVQRVGLILAFLVDMATRQVQKRQQEGHCQIQRCAGGLKCSERLSFKD